MRALLQALYNILANPNATNTGGMFPSLGAATQVPAGKSYAIPAAWTEIATAATVTSNIWVYALYGEALYISGGVHWWVQLGTGGAGSEAALTGSQAKFGHSQATAVGEVMDQQWSYGAFPLYIPAGTRIAARAGSSNNAADVIGVQVAYRTGLGS